MNKLNNKSSKIINKVKNEEYIQDLNKGFQIMSIIHIERDQNRDQSIINIIIIMIDKRKITKIIEIINITKIIKITKKSIIIIGIIKIKNTTTTRIIEMITSTSTNLKSILNKIFKVKKENVLEPDLHIRYSEITIITYKIR